MTVFYWVFFGLAVFGIVAMSSAIYSLISHFNKKENTQRSTQPLSVIVPIKGADKNTESNLKNLVNSVLESPVEYLFAMETKDDPAYSICRYIVESFPNKDISVILTGLSKELMGKQHNIKSAVLESKYDVIASMDADVVVSADTLNKGLVALTSTKAGIVYCLPYYEGSGLSGGSLLKTYINNFYNIIFSYLHFYAKAPTIIGALWIMPKELFIKCEADGRLSSTVSDDRELGFATAEFGYKNTLLPITVKMPHEDLSLKEGINHLGKWFSMVRAEGLPVYILFLFLWNPLICSVISLLYAQSVSNEYTIWSTILIMSILLLRSIGVFLLNSKIYKVPVYSNLAMTLVYDAVLFPVIFIMNLSKNTIEWKGKKYKLGKHGKILS
jgi:ceramide glucosyltransferase